ncbi:MAG: tyrosine-type recombinase/integrase [Burkholderiales bacterium]
MRAIAARDAATLIAHLKRIARARNTTRAQLRDAAACLLGMHGLRIGEVLQLEVSDFLLRDQKLKVRTLKRGPWRIVPIDTATWSVLLKLRKQAEQNKIALVFRTSTNKKCDPKNLRSQFQSWSRMAINATPRFHDMRHTVAQCVYEQSGHDLLIVKKLLGHKSIESTLIYLQGGKELREMMPTIVFAPKKKQKAPQA